MAATDVTLVHPILRCLMALWTNRAVGAFGLRPFEQRFCHEQCVERDADDAGQDQEVRVTIVARQLQTDGGFGEVSASGVNTSGPVIVSDHDPSVDPGYNATTYSKLRRRVVTKIIQPRNL